MTIPLANNLSCGTIPQWAHSEVRLEVFGERFGFKFSKHNRIDRSRSLALAAGLFLGGKRIIKSVGMNMVKMKRYQSVAASAGTIVTLFVASMTGMPVSSSHCATSSIMGVGAEKSVRRVNWDLAKSMVFAWVLTFPACGLIGFLLAKLFLLF